MRHRLNFESKHPTKKICFVRFLDNNAIIINYYVGLLGCSGWADSMCNMRKDDLKLLLARMLTDLILKIFDPGILSILLLRSHTMFEGNHLNRICPLCYAVASDFLTLFTFLLLLWDV